MASHGYYLQNYNRIEREESRWAERIINMMADGDVIGL